MSYGYGPQGPQGSHAFDEVDVDGGGDHLGELAEVADPYPTTRAAYSRALVHTREDARTDPEEARHALAGYAGQPTRHGTYVRQIVAPEWTGATFLLSAGKNSFQIVDEDPARTLIEITNHTDGKVYVATTAGETVGAGTILLPPRDASGAPGRPLTIRATSAVYLYTDAMFVPAPGAEAVTWYIERLPVTS